MNRLPLAGGTQTGGIAFEGIDLEATETANVDYRSITPDYFRALEIRLALGARPVEIVRDVLRRGLGLFAAGSLVGLIAAVASARALGSLLFNVSRFDVFSFAAATIVLFVVALAACALPARRAASVDPSIALRTE